MRMQKIHPSSLAVALAPAILLIPSLVLGQSAQPAPAVAFSPPAQHESVITRTQELENDGQALLAVASARVQGARMLETAGLQRAPSDARSVSDLLIAGSSFYWAGNPERARAVFKTLGSREKSVGDVPGAANAYLMAAWVANQEGDRVDAADLLHSVERLAASPALSEQARRSILDRIADPQAVAVRTH